VSEQLERALRESFANLRSADAERAPDVRAVLSGPRSRKPRLRPLPVVGVLAAITVFTLLFRRTDAAPSGLDVLTWRPATDALLMMSRPDFGALRQLPTSSLESLTRTPSVRKVDQ